MMRSLAVAAAILALGLAPVPPEKLSFVDLQPKANHKLDEDSGRGIEGNNLGSVPQGEQTLGGVKFRVGKGMLQLDSPLLKNPRLDKVEGKGTAARSRKSAAARKTSSAPPEPPSSS